jgi:uncharacterized protein DUF4145
LSEDGQTTKWILCIACNSPTTHVLRARFYLRQTFVEALGDWEQIEIASAALVPFGVHRYSIWQCAGCTTPTLETEYVYVGGSDLAPGCEDSLDLDYQNDDVDKEFFPKRSLETIGPKGFRNLNPELTRLYREIIACFNNGSFLLCTVGLRALIEGICDDKGIDGKLKFERRIDELIKFLPSVNVIEALHDLRIAGNDAAHRLEALTPDKAREAIDIMEDLLNFLYDLSYKASQMNTKSKRAALKSAKLDSVQ